MMSEPKSEVYYLPLKVQTRRDSNMGFVSYKEYSGPMDIGLLDHNRLPVRLKAGTLNKGLVSVESIVGSVFGTPSILAQGQDLERD